MCVLLDTEDKKCLLVTVAARDACDCKEITAYLFQRDRNYLIKPDKFILLTLIAKTDGVKQSKVCLR